MPRGASGLLCLDYQGKKADRLPTHIDPGVISPNYAGMNCRLPMNWVNGRLVAITLAMICSRKDLEEMERRALALQTGIGTGKGLSKTHFQREGRPDPSRSLRNMR